MRLKKVKDADIKINNSPYIIANPISYNGNFKILFNNENPIHVEIGMGKGNFIIEMAKKFPDINFIGIEKFDSVMVRAVEKLENVELKNLKLIKCDAINVKNIFNHEIDTLYLNFSDPWPKNRHENRRLTSKVFLSLYDSLFVDKKHIIMKTDNRKFFEYSIMSFTDYGYKINELSLDLYSDNYKDNVQTEYEAKFTLKGDRIYRIDISK